MNDGPVAHLGERFNGIEEVAGSIPVRSTKFRAFGAHEDFLENFSRKTIHSLREAS